MENEIEVRAVAVAVKSEVYRLVSENFMREEFGSSATHTYDLRTHLMIQIKKIFLPPTFPDSSGKSIQTKGDRGQQRISYCGWVTVIEHR